MLLNFHIELFKHNKWYNCGNDIFIPAGSGPFIQFKKGIVYRCNAYTSNTPFNIPIFVVEVHSSKPQARAMYAYDQRQNLDVIIDYIFSEIVAFDREKKSYPCICS
jgi:hypothetical protein